ncbi:hypothetical protein GOODEAATRI_012902 [Goodea atripinnis]|uniref:Hexosyltransferase n=1 Tax=Goodea atripinnis TaxID=208336 RepID=A0ABV0PND9_9TELE
MEIVTVADPSLLVPSDVSAIALDFKVLHPVVITRLGVFSSGTQPELHSNVTVKLLQLDQEEAVVTARFSSISMGTMANWVWYKPVEQFILPKGFEGTLVWESQDSAALTSVNSSSVELNDGGGVLKISSNKYLQHFFLVCYLFTPDYLYGVGPSITTCASDEDGLSWLLQGRAARMEKHASSLRREDADLQEESLRHGDMVFVDVVDTYRNVPSKLLQFYKCFRQSWAVDRIGKWQELEYASPAYPAFACGSGYVVSRDLVQWLASNAKKLKAYQPSDRRNIRTVVWPYMTSLWLL